MTSQVDTALASPSCWQRPRPAPVLAVRVGLSRRRTRPIGRWRWLRVAAALRLRRALGTPMPGLGRVPPDVRTVYLGQYTEDHANRIAEQLEADGVVWSAKEPGFLSAIWEHGIRLFVDRTKLDQARELAARVTSDM